MRKALNTAVVAAAKLPPGMAQLDLWDSKLRGFGLRIGKHDRTWQVMVRVGGRKQRLKLGTAASMGLADARDAARRVMGEIASGSNPAAERAAERSAPTFREVADLFLSDFQRQVERGERRSATLQTYRGQVENHLNPAWGAMKMADIRRRDIIALLEAVVRRGTPILGNRLRALVSTVFRYAEDREIIEANPATRIKAPAANRTRSRVLDQEELHRLFAAVDNPRYRTIMIAALLTASRKSELLGMRTDEVDSEGWWVIPAARSKNHREHRLPLVAAVRDALAALPRHHSGLVFGGPQNASQRTTWWFRDLCRQVGIQDAVFHDLRRTAASHLNRVGVESGLVERILNHSRGGVEAVYNRYSFDAEKARALARWEKELLRIITGETADNVVQLRA